MPERPPMRGGDSPEEGHELHNAPEVDEATERSENMKVLTAIERKVEKSEPLTKGDLVFLYEIDRRFATHEIDYTRFAKLRDNRNPKEDAPVVLGYRSDQVVWSEKDINADTKAYFGPLFNGIFEFENLDVYKSLLDKKIERLRLEIGGKSPKEYRQELERTDNKIGEHAKDILQNMPVTKEKQDIELIRINVEDLGFTTLARYDELCKRAEEMGLDLAPAEAGPAYRLTLQEQAPGDSAVIATKPLIDSHDGPFLFKVSHDGVDRWLETDGGEPHIGFAPWQSLVFRRRKSPRT